MGACHVRALRFSRGLVAAVLLVLVAACRSPPPATPGDAGAPPVVGGPTDAGPPADGGTPDAGTSDAGVDGGGTAFGPSGVEPGRYAWLQTEDLPPPDTTRVQVT